MFRCIFICPFEINLYAISSKYTNFHNNSINRTAIKSTLHRMKINKIVIKVTTVKGEEISHKNIPPRINIVTALEFAHCSIYSILSFVVPNAFSLTKPACRCNKQLIK